jgi:hypothetical protein
MWSTEEVELLGLLIHAGCNLRNRGRCCCNIYALVHRAKTATSGHWYKLQRESYRINHVGQQGSHLVSQKCGSSSFVGIGSGKRYSGDPTTTSMDQNHEVLRKRGIIDDSMSPETKKDKLSMYNADVQRGLIR